MQQRAGLREQGVLAGDVHRADVADGRAEVRLDLLAEVCSILDDAGDE
jgi:hypothetical protein